jgi:hypothetical protein
MIAQRVIEALYAFRIPDALRFVCEIALQLWSDVDRIVRLLLPNASTFADAPTHALARNESPAYTRFSAAVTRVPTTSFDAPDPAQP